jgi:hypothetical protein
MQWLVTDSSLIKEKVLTVIEDAACGLGPKLVNDDPMLGLKEHW